jgi:hypothetical protein
MLDSAARIKFASVSARRLLRDYCDDADRTRLPQAVEDWFQHDRRRLNSDSLPPRGKPLTIDCEHGRLVVTRMNGDNRVLPLVEDSKLGVHSRTAALARVRELNLGETQ